jgi:hypothetical protein
MVGHASPGADGAMHAFPVSVKGVAVADGKVLLLENERAGLFSHSQVPGLNMPAGYKRSIATWFARVDR